jgi:hypothetical protein
MAMVDFLVHLQLQLLLWVEEYLGKDLTDNGYTYT